MFDRMAITRFSFYWWGKDDGVCEIFFANFSLYAKEFATGKAWASQMRRPCQRDSRMPYSLSRIKYTTPELFSVRWNAFTRLPFVWCLRRQPPPLPPGTSVIFFFVVTELCRGLICLILKDGTSTLWKMPVRQFSPRAREEPFSGMYQVRTANDGAQKIIWLGTAIYVSTLSEWSDTLTVSAQIVFLKEHSKQWNWLLHKAD